MGVFTNCCELASVEFASAWAVSLLVVLAAGAGGMVAVVVGSAVVLAVELPVCSALFVSGAMLVVARVGSGALASAVVLVVVFEMVSVVVLVVVLPVAFVVFDAVLVVVLSAVFVVVLMVRDEAPASMEGVAAASAGWLVVAAGTGAEGSAVAGLTAPVWGDAVGGCCGASPG